MEIYKYELCWDITELLLLLPFLLLLLLLLLLLHLLLLLLLLLLPPSLAAVTRTSRLWHSGPAYACTAARAGRCLLLNFLQIMIL